MAIEIIATTVPTTNTKQILRAIYSGRNALIDPLRMIAKNRIIHTIIGFEHIIAVLAVFEFKGFIAIKAVFNMLNVVATELFIRMSKIVFSRKSKTVLGI